MENVPFIIQPLLNPGFQVEYPKRFPFAEKLKYITITFWSFYLVNDLNLHCWEITCMVISKMMGYIGWEVLFYVVQMFIKPVSKSPNCAPHILNVTCLAGDQINNICDITIKNWIHFICLIFHWWTKSITFQNMRSCGARCTTTEIVPFTMYPSDFFFFCGIKEARGKWITQCWSSPWDNINCRLGVQHMFDPQTKQVNIGLQFS